jgi:hypothetical protein
MWLTHSVRALAFNLRSDTDLLRPGQQPASDSMPAKSRIPEKNHFIASTPVRKSRTA